MSLLMMMSWLLAMEQSIVQPANDPVYEALLIQVAREAKHQQKIGRLLVV